MNAPHHRSADPEGTGRITPDGSPDSAPDLAALLGEAREALVRLCKSFPTDDDMLIANWDQASVDEACDAYEAARDAIARIDAARKVKP